MDVKPPEIFKQPVVRENIGVLDSTLPKDANVRAVRFTGSGTVLGHSEFTIGSSFLVSTRRKTFAVPFRGFIRAFNFVCRQNTGIIRIMPIWSRTADITDLPLGDFTADVHLANIKSNAAGEFAGFSAPQAGTLYGCAVGFLIHESPAFLGVQAALLGGPATCEFWFDYLQVY